MISTSQHANGRVDHPMEAGRRSAAAWFAAKAVSLGTKVAFIAACGLVLARPGTLGATVAGLLAVLVVSLLLQRALSRDAWSYVPGAFSRRYAARGDTYTEPTLNLFDFIWLLVEAAVWIVGGALITAVVPGPWSSGFLLVFGIYLLTVTVSLRIGSQVRGHWLLDMSPAIFGGAWIGQGLIAEPSLAHLWPMLLTEAIICAFLVVLVRTLRGAAR